MKRSILSALITLMVCTPMLSALTRPGILWKQRWNPWGRPGFTAIAANPAGEMLAVGGNMLFHSTDGTLWSPSNKNGGLAFQNVIWSSHDEWLVTGLDGTIMTSPDALTWTVHSLGQLGYRSLGPAIAGPGASVIPCNGITAISLSSTSWITRPSNLSVIGEGPQDLHAFTPAPLTYPIIVATVFQEGGIYASEDTLNWIPQQSAEPDELFFSVGGNNSLLVASAIAPTDFTIGTRFYTSPDGVNWTRRFIPGLTAPFHDIIWTGSRFVACAKEIPANTPVIFTSPDGITWSHHAPPGQINRLCWNGSMIVGTGNSGAYYTCSDPAPDAPDDWDLPVLSIFRKNVSGIASAQISGLTRVVSVGENGLILYSETGGSSFATVTSPTAVKLRDVIATSLPAHRFIALGNELLVTSPDGTTWTVQSGPGIPDANGGEWFTPLLSGGSSRAITVGSAGRIHTSTDGTTWTARTSGTIAYLQSVASGFYLGPKPDNNLGEKLVAVGFGGTILTSSSGTTWSLESSGTTANLNDVCRLYRGFITCGEDGTLLRSLNGSTWTQVTLPDGFDTSEPLFSCCWTGEHVLVTGSNLVLSSPDGVNWSLQRCLTGTPYGLISLGNNNRVLAAGAGGIFSSDPVISYDEWASLVGIPAAENAPGDDPNGDSFSNLISYAFNINPVGPATPSSFRVLPRLSGSDPRSLMRLRLSPGNHPGDLTYILETSPTLAPGSWTEVMRSHAGDLRPTGSLHFSETEGADHIEIEFPEPVGFSGNLFIRLRLDLDP